MYIIPMAHHVFSSFLFYQELRTFKNYRAFRFKLPDKKLISLRRITISPVECRCSIKICSFSFFRIWSAIAQQITSDLCQYCTSFRVFIRLELDVQLYLHFPLCVVSMQISTSRHFAAAGKSYLRKMYILVARFIFDDSAMVVFKGRFSNCNGAIVSRKIRSDGC